MNQDNTNNQFGNLMKNLLLSLLVLTCSTSQAQVYTRGDANQMYWDWRPDIANNCYEFTYIHYAKVNIASPHYDYKIGIIFWNDCNYGKTYVFDTAGNFLHAPLQDTLYRVTSYYGERDTVCGYSMPYNAGTNINFAQKTSPVRTMLIYKGLVHLPEKCIWHFSISKTFYSNAADQRYFTNGTDDDGLSTPTYTNLKSNIDSICYYNRVGFIHSDNSLSKVPIICSFDNTDYSNINSVRFSSSPIYYYPQDKIIEYNPGGFDPDHDSISYTIPDTIKSVTGLVNVPSFIGNSTFYPKDNAGNQLSDILCEKWYFAPLLGQMGPNPLRYNSQNNPFDTDSTFHLVDSTGKTTFTAKGEMEPILYYRVRKYRNHKFLSETFLINQFSIFNDNREVSFLRIDTNSVQNALFNSQGTLMSCTGLPISFDAYVKLPIVNANLIVTATADSTLPGNGACTMTGLNTDSVRLHLTWTPPVNARGLYNVFVSAKDSTCTAPYNQYTQVFTWSFYIDSCLSPLSVKNVMNTNELVLYPNPSSNNLMISCNETFSTVKIYTLLSKLLIEKKMKPTKQSEINTSDLREGIYIVNIDGKFVRKLVIAR